MATKFYAAMATITEADGRKHALRVGSGTTLSDGSILVSIDAVPMAHKWNGNYRLYPNDDAANPRGDDNG